ASGAGPVGKGGPTGPRPGGPCSTNGLFDGGINALGRNPIATARPPQTSQPYRIPPEVRSSFSGTRHRGQVSETSSGIRGHLIAVLPSKVENGAAGKSAT